MKISAVITGRKSNTLYSAVNENKSALISALCIALGITVGALVYILNAENLTGALWEYFISFSTEFTQKNKPEIISGLILANLIYFCAMLILGTCAFGTPAVFALSAVKSMGLGMLTSYIYDSFALKGIEYCLLVLFPGKILLIFAMVLLTQNCYITSLEIRNSLSKGDRVVEFRKYTLRSLFILTILLLSSATDFLTIISFSSLFDFS